MLRSALGLDPYHRPPARRSPRGGQAVGRPRGGQTAGFSLLEVLVVVLIVGIATAVLAPSTLQQLKKARLGSTASNVANLMNQTRLRAIRDNTIYTVQVAASGEEVTGMANYGPQDDPELLRLIPQRSTMIYNIGDGTATCLNKYDGAGGTFDGDSIVYQGTGLATGTAAICVHDGDGNILQVVVEYPTAQPKIRKFLPATDAPGGNAGFYEKTGFNVDTEESNIWVWY